MALLALACTAPEAQAANKMDYNRDIRPILSENCFSCHGFDEKARKAKLRLDEKESAYAERDGTIAIKPGDLKNSEAWQRITSTDEDEVMPPPKAHLDLTAADKAKLKAWIEQGAPYAGHWSFIAPQRPPIPPGAANPIDALVHQRLSEEGLKPSPQADRRTLIRRLSLDLIGLPPTPEEVAAFASDESPQAYEHLVDRLLANPHFGERLALDWLDAARYADTNGYSIDGGRTMWLWRDWVIQAFNDNKPYDRFLTEQIAGDLLPNRTDADLIATGFQRNNMVTHEGGTIPEENLTNYNVDRVKTLGESVLGLTLACAQCHNHKFDPITQRDYYQMFAFFNSLGDRGLDGDGGVNPGPSIQTKTVLKTDEEPRLREQIDALKAKLERPDPAVLAAWEQRERAKLAVRGQGLSVHPVQVLKVSTPNRGAGYGISGTNGVRVRQAGNLGAFDISTELPKLSEPITGLRVVMQPAADLPGGGWGSGQLEKNGKGTFVLTNVSLTADAVPGDQINLHKLEDIAGVTASSWENDFPPADCLEPLNETGWSPSLASTGPARLTATLAHPLNAARTPYLTVQLNFGHGKGLIPGQIELSVITGHDDDSDLPPAILETLAIPTAKRSAAQMAELWKYCAAHADEFSRARTDLANLQDRLTALTQKFPTMVMDVATKPRDTYILNRGDYTQRTGKVSAGTIAALPAMPADTAPNRLGLARWITMRENPLTARVAVNRFWKLLFGTGIVATPADFGAQGEWPSHPDVLDWLAVEFMESGWDVKHLFKLIVMSDTYRQSSAATPEALEHDPQNRLLARGPRFRLPAELVRDEALAVSGLLVPRVGGPSVNPYTPGDLWREVSHYGSTPATAQAFVQDHGEKLYRRSLYTFVKRTAPPPNMVTFDAPNREVCTIARGNTTTPLQSLVLLNDPQFVEAARVFAERILHQPGDDAARLKWSFFTAAAREPKPAELAVLRGTLTRERQRYTAHADAAERALNVGEAPRDAHIPAPEHAAWMQVATLLFNLSEFVTRN